MNAKSCFLSVLSALLLAGVTGSNAHAQFTPLLQRVPDSANTIFLLNAEKAFNSELAMKEGWQKNFAKSIERGLVHLPADTMQYVLAGQIDFDSTQPVWQVGAVKTKNKHDMVVIAKKSGGERDTIEGHEAVLLPSGAYVVQCDPFTIATMVPAGRQAVARWIADTEKAAPQFTPYIQEAIGYAEKSGTELIMALDLTDALDPAVVKARVDESALVADKKLDAAEVTAVLLSAKGIMLGVTLGEKPYGSIKVDFGRDAKVLEGSAGQLLIDGLANRGAMIDDFQSWKEAVKGNTVTFSGYLTRTGLRQITSLLDAPIASAVAADEPAPESPSDQDPAAVAAQKYFSSVNQYFEDLRDKEPQRIAQYGAGLRNTRARSTSCRWSTSTATCWTTAPTSRNSCAMPPQRSRASASAPASARWTPRKTAVVPPVTMAQLTMAAMPTAGTTTTATTVLRGGTTSRKACVSSRWPAPR